MKRRCIARAIAMTTTLGLGLALGGCSFAPSYQRPATTVPASWPAGDAYLRQSEATLPAVSYRDIFRDPHLVALIDQALANNQDLRAALANVRAARAQAKVVRADIFPGIEAGGGVTTGESSKATGSSGSASSGGRHTGYSADIGTTGWEIDLFGRLRSLSDASFNQYLGTEAGARATRLALTAEVANAYLTLATDRSLLVVSQDTQKAASRSVELNRALLKGGVAPRTDLRQAETILSQAEADQAVLETSVAQDRNALELLVGGPVGDDLLPASIESIDGLLGEVPAGLDSSILLRRPDVVEAEYQLRAANARIGAARAAFFPRISLTALAGFASTALTDLFTGDAFTWTVAPAVSLPIFEGGANIGNLHLSQAQRDVAIASYRKAVQTAFREVADALARRGTIDRQYAATVRLEAAARDTLGLATARYREGVDAYLTTLDAQRTAYSARRTLAGVRLTRALNLVELYRSLGGDQLVDMLPPPKPGKNTKPQDATN